MTSSLNKNTSVHSQQDIYSNLSHKYEESKKKGNISDRVDLSNSSNYGSHLDRLFEHTKTTHIYIDPPPRAPVIERRLFLLDIIRDFVNLDSYWKCSLRKLDNLPEGLSAREIRKLFELMANLSQISRDISSKRTLQKN